MWNWAVMAVSFYKSQIFLPSLNSVPKLNGPRNCFFTHPILHTNQLIRHTTTLVSAFPSTVSESSTQKIPSFNEVWISGCFILCLFVILASGFYWFLIFFLVVAVDWNIDKSCWFVWDWSWGFPGFFTERCKWSTDKCFSCSAESQRRDIWRGKSSLLWGSVGLSFINWHFKIVVSCTTPWNW